MKTFKKIAALLLAGAMMVTVLAACGGSSTSTTAAAGEGDTEASGGVLHMVTEATFPPYEYYEGDKIIGIDVEIAEAIADKLGMTLEVEDMAFDSLIPAIASGKADIAAAGMTVTEERLENVNFTDTYANGVQVIIVRQDSDITSADDIEGKTIAVQTGTTGEIYADGLGELSSFTKATDAVLEVINGKADCMIIDSQPAQKYVEANPELKILEEDFENEDYAMAIAKENTELLDKVNGALAELKESGKLDEIISKYIDAE